MTSDFIEYSTYKLAYFFTPEKERPWSGETKKIIEYEFFITSNPELTNLKKLLEKELKRVSKWEKLYLESVESWKITIKNLIDNLGQECTNRYLQLKPNVDEKQVTSCKDFTDLNKYFQRRRNIEYCSDEEVGCLAVLLTEIQRRIEKQLDSISKNSLPESDKENKFDFVAIDFEHATPNKGTVCAVGIACVKNKKIVDTYYTLIQPPNNEYFKWNSIIHGIFPTDTKDSPSFINIWPEIRKRIINNTIIAHGATHTDKHCLEQAMSYYNITENINISWIDTQTYCNASLDILCKACNISLAHHNALSDAKGCAEIYLRIIEGTFPFDVIQSIKSSQQTIAEFKENHSPIQRELLFPEFENVQNKNNPFYKKKVVISGNYERWPNRDELGIVLKELGADIDRSIGKYTNILCAGSDCGPVKLKKMQELIDAGKDAKILREDEILKLIQESGFSEQ